MASINYQPQNRGVGEIEFTGNSSETVISSIDEWVDIAEPAWTAPILNSFEVPSNGQLRYIGNTSLDALILFKFSISTSPNSIDVGVRIVDDGVQIGNDIAESLPGNTEIQDTLIEASKLSHGEIIKPQIRNRTNTNNITVVQASFVLFI